ncbi:FMN-dependent NADH-azoreductase [Mycoplasmopsis californica]|uniref:FMN dependent NADH:quinone oxidoreductase n=1 Tax=Mycoplasmopsis equigenitalium TaxID=114883 RepID=A0ABY5J2G7_9BACT|nr:FMN-dependent NADH-azoreductase [Mycoplasmopsis equigenitalium]UUD36963.1 FMN-dependent NADH-azoreductase [Mycoplasmopsis equigenitalium]VEU69742.1 FMN-dependent NADH-azoreductase [Mycoplasmopsis californica]
MKKVLFIKSSIVTDENSVTTNLLKAFEKKYLEKNPKDKIVWLDLNEENLIALTSKNMSSYFNEKADAYINQLKDVDKLVVAAPMYNFNVPATLKIYIDMIAQANKTFTYKYAGKNRSKGLLENLSVEIITSQGAPIDWYPWANIPQFLSSFFEFLGMKVHGSIQFAGAKVAGFELTKLNFDELVKKDASSF